MKEHKDFRGKTINLLDIVAYAGRGKSTSFITHDNRGAAIMRVAQVSKLSHEGVQIAFTTNPGERAVRILVKDPRKIAVL